MVTPPEGGVFVRNDEIFYFGWLFEPPELLEPPEPDDDIALKNASILSFSSVIISA